MTGFLPMVLLETVQRPNWERVAQFLRSRHPGLQPPAEVQAAEGEDAPALLAVGGRRFALLFVDRPVPREEIAAATEFGTADIRAAAERHVAHVIVGELGAPEGGEPDTAGAVARARLATQVAGAVAATVPGATAVYHGSAGMLFAAAQYAELAKTHNMDCETMWVGLRAFAGAKPLLGRAKVGFATQGLSHFVGRELHAAPSGRPVDWQRERVYALMFYLLANGPVIADGHTVGASQTERIRVRHGAAPSGQPAYLLHF